MSSSTQLTQLGQLCIMVLVPIHIEERDHGAGMTAECFKSMDCGIAKIAPTGPRVRCVEGGRREGCHKGGGNGSIGCRFFQMFVIWGLPYKDPFSSKRK